MSDGSSKGGWWFAVPVLGAICCAGPALLTAAGIGSLGAIIGGVTGVFALVCTGALAVAVAALVVVRRRRRLSQHSPVDQHAPLDKHGRVDQPSP